NPLVAGADRVLEPQIDGIDSELFRQLIELAFACERDLWIAEAAKAGGAELVRVDKLSGRAEIRNPIRAARHIKAKSQHARAVVAVGATVEDELYLARNQRSVAPGAGAHPDARRVTASHHGEVVFARKHNLHRPFRLEGERGSNRLDRRFHLSAKAAANARGDDAHLRHRKAESFADICLHAIDRLMRRPDGNLVPIVYLCERSTRLEVGVRLRLGAVFPFYNNIAGRKRCIDIALDDRLLGKNIAAETTIENLEILRQVLVDDGSAGCQRLIHIQDSRQLLVLHLDKLESVKRDGKIHSGDRRDRLAHVAHLVSREDSLVFDDGTHGQIGKVLGADHGLHAGESFRFRGIAGEDACMRVGAAQYRAVQHERSVEVISISRRAVDFALRLESRKPRANDTFRATHPTSLLATARRTAATTLT